MDKATDIEEKGTFTWTVTFANGVYRYQCDAHAASVGPGAKITIGRLGVQINTIAAGPVEITVNDRSAKDNFRLSGPGVNRATSKPGKGTSVWKLTLKPGTYVYRSDATPKLRGTFRAV